MSSEHENLNSIEQSLASFALAAPQLDRDRLMFLAGQASGGTSSLARTGIGSRNWYWPAATATLAATSLGLAIAMFTRPAPQTQYIVRDQPVSNPMEKSPADLVAVQPQSPQPSRLVAAPIRPPQETGDSYLKTRDVALRMGLDALGSPSPGRSGFSRSTTYLDLLEGLAGGSPAGPATGSTERLPNM